MKTHLALLNLLAGSLAFTTTAVAQKSYAIGIAGGAAIPAGHLRDNQVSGYNGTIALAIGVADLPFGVRFDGIFNYFGRRDVISPASSIGGGAFNTQITGALGNLVYAFPGTNAKPYLIAGAGWYSVRRKGDGSKSESSVGYNAGGGVTFGLGPVALFLESRYHSISRSAAKGGVVQFVPITLGLMF